MDNIHLLGSIASIISFSIPFGFVFWSVIKKRKISFSNLYMLVMVLIQAVLVGYWIWNGKNLIAAMAGLGLIATILFWLIMSLIEKLLDLIDSQAEISKSQAKIIKEINQDMGQLVRSFVESTEVIRELMRIESIRIDVKTEQLDNKLKKIQKKIGTKKSTK